MTSTTLVDMPPGWAPALPQDRCNYHRDRPALARYVGTPMCSGCIARIKPDLAKALAA